jgi:hypothetical protein
MFHMEHLKKRLRKVLISIPLCCTISGVEGRQEMEREFWVAVVLVVVMVHQGAVMRFAEQPLLEPVRVQRLAE